MTTEKNSSDVEYGEFLETFEPTDLLKHSTQEAYLFDPLAQNKLLEDVAGVGTIPRVKKLPKTHNVISDEERRILRFDFFEKMQDDWSVDFQERMIGEDVRADRLAEFTEAMVNVWTDGKQRQSASVMCRLKYGILLHDQTFHPRNAGLFAINVPVEVSDPLFEVHEIAALFKVNEGMLENYLAEYIRVRDGLSGSINTLYTRRGVCMPHEPKTHLEEAHYLSSYSLATGPVEQFAQTYGKGPCNGIPCIFSCPVPAIQQRVVAFAPFIKDMALDQVELVVAPPIEETPLRKHRLLLNSNVIIHDYEFT